ncbi:MAG: cupredoxin domain-containing protein, partial [Chloroflexota bacterium]
IAACGGAAPSTGPATPVPADKVFVQASNSSGAYTFTPSTLSVAAGKVTFSVRNAGGEEHEFEIFKGEKVIEEIEGIVPGLTKELTVTLEAGDYTFVCKLNGHDLAGMKGTLTVN